MRFSAPAAVATPSTDSSTTNARVTGVAHTMRVHICLRDVEANLAACGMHNLPKTRGVETATHSQRSGRRALPKAIPSRNRSRRATLAVDVQRRGLRRQAPHVKCLAVLFRR